MGEYEQLKAAIADIVKTNGNAEITGALLQQVLVGMVTQIGGNMTFAGFAKPSTDPDDPDAHCFYLATTAGQYVYFDNYTLPSDTLAVFYNTGGTWAHETIPLGSGGGGGITIDPTPTQGSANAVSSGGVYSALQGKQDSITFDPAPVDNSTNAVTSGGVYDALAGKQDTLTIDPAPTDGSANPVASNGVYDALATKQNSLTIDAVPTDGSDNPVASNGVYDALATKQDTISDLATIRSGAAAGATAYQLPASGIPASDLANAVQISLGKADTALQSYTETDPVFAASAAYGITSNDISTWNGKQDELVSGTNIKSVNGTTLLGAGNLNATLIPVLTDTRSSATSTITTSAASFDALASGQIVAINLAYNTAASTTLQVTLSDNTTTTAAALKSQTSSGSTQIGTNTLKKNTTIMCLYNGSEWWLMGMVDTNSIYAALSYAAVADGTSTSSGLVSGASLHYAFYGKSDIDTYLAAKQDVRSVVQTSTLAANTYNELGTTDTVAPTLPASYTAADEFIFTFTCSSASCAVSLPTGVTLGSGLDFTSDVAASRTFQFSIQNDIALYTYVD